jgi:two-component sensor histidine kinase
MENKIGQIYSYSEDTNFPFFLTGILFPFGYYFYIRFLQITQPAAISGITNDELQASPALQKTVSKIIVQEFTQAISHRWAIYIHGKILTRLAATSLKLEQAVALNDQATFDSALNEIDEILKNPTRDFENGFGTVESEILSRLDPWNGLIEIALSIVPEIASISNPRVRDLGEVIEEIVSNSVRHGGSQIINVEVTQLAHPDIQIVVSDDAQNPLPFVSSRIGLGTKILNLVSDGRWTIFHENSKTTVKLTMSLRDERE